jgi:hypothetical protein
LLIWFLLALRHVRARKREQRVVQVQAVSEPASRGIRPVAARRVSSPAARRRVTDNDDVVRAGRSHVACAA